MRRPLTNEQKTERLAAFGTSRLLQAVDAVDAMREHLEGEGYAPPEIRNDILKLHALAMNVSGTVGPDTESMRALFELADGIDCRVGEVADALENLRAIIEELTVPEPDDLGPVDIVR